MENLRIIGLYAENVKKIRVVEINPKGRVVQITGKNGQGKSSVLDAIWYALAGRRAFPEKPVRKGSDKMTVKLNLGELRVTRTLTNTGAMTLTVEDPKGTKFQSPQAMLDSLIGELTFDPLEFAQMDTKEQVNALRGFVKTGIDMDLLNTQNKEDFERRREVNRDLARLQSARDLILVQDGLPAAAIDDAAIMVELASAGLKNEEALAIDQAYQHAAQHAEKLRSAVEGANDIIAGADIEIKDLEKRLAQAKKHREQMLLARDESEAEAKKAEDSLTQMPRGQFVDVTKLTADLKEAQVINRAIAKRTQREALQREINDLERQSMNLTRNMEDREEKKREAIAEAKLPFPGLSFTEEQVLLNGVPISQAGEAEQIRVSVSLAMAANPKLRILRIVHGEAMDEDGMKILSEMAEEHDYQIWVSRVDSTGRVGIVMEDGTVKQVNE